MHTPPTTLEFHAGAAVQRASVQRRQDGFTLIEILVGVVIVGIVVGVVALSLGRDRGPARLRIAAERAQALITAYCRQGAILQGHVVGLRVAPAEYEFLVYQGELWQPLPQGKVEQLSSGLEAWVSLDGRRADATDEELPQPQILCLPSGELTPFQIHFEIADDALELTLNGAANGQLEILQRGL